MTKHKTFITAEEARQTGLLHETEKYPEEAKIIYDATWSSLLRQQKLTSATVPIRYQKTMPHLLGLMGYTVENVIREEDGRITFIWCWSVQPATK